MADIPPKTASEAEPAGDNGALVPNPEVAERLRLYGMHAKGMIEKLASMPGITVADVDAAWPRTASAHDRAAVLAGHVEAIVQERIDAERVRAAREAANAAEAAERRRAAAAVRPYHERLAKARATLERYDQDDVKYAFDELRKVLPDSVTRYASSPYAVSVVEQVAEIIVHLGKPKYPRLMERVA